VSHGVGADVRLLKGATLSGSSTMCWNSMCHLNCVGHKATPCLVQWTLCVQSQRMPLDGGEGRRQNRELDVVSHGVGADVRLLKGATLSGSSAILWDSSPV
jgi:hypothetical protein